MVVVPRPCEGCAEEVINVAHELDSDTFLKFASEALFLCGIFGIEHEVVHVHAHVDLGSGWRRGHRDCVRGVGCSVERSPGDGGGFADSAGEQAWIVGSG